MTVFKKTQGTSSSALHFSLLPNDFLGLNYERIGKSGQHCMAGFFREQVFLTILAGVKFLGSLIIGLSNGPSPLTFDHN